MSWKGQRWALEGSLFTGIGKSGNARKRRVCSQRGSKHNCWQELGTAGARKVIYQRDRNTAEKFILLFSGLRFFNELEAFA